MGALFVVNTPGSMLRGPQYQIAVAENSLGRPASTEEMIASAPPANITDFYNNAAKELASSYYEGVPVVYLTPTKENALAGTLFGCDFDGEALIEEYKKLMFM